MKLSTRARYGTRVLLDLALHSSEEPVQLKNIAQRQEVSLPYVEHLITPLIAAGILKSTRGKRGGVSLAKPPQEIRLNEIVQIMEGDISVADCVNDPKVCPRSASCATRDVWREMKEVINGVLESITLQDLVERQKTKQPRAATYYI